MPMCPPMWAHWPNVSSHVGTLAQCPLQCGHTGPMCPPMWAHRPNVPSHVGTPAQCAIPCGHTGPMCHPMWAHWPNVPSHVGTLAQCAIPCGHTGPMCHPMWAHWRHWQIQLNLCFLRLTPVHNPNGKSIGSAISAQLMAESPYALLWATLSQKLPLLMRDLDPM